jgi:NAD(P)-dependent dehydrogenase (short-subunit alcohol dehydrogenase family)
MITPDALAGADQPAGRWQVPLEDWHEVLDVSLTGTSLTMQSAAKRMRFGASIIPIDRGQGAGGGNALIQRLQDGRVNADQVRGLPWGMSQQLARPEPGYRIRQHQGHVEVRYRGTEPQLLGREAV